MEGWKDSLEASCRRLDLRWSGGEAQVDWFGGDAAAGLVLFLHGSGSGRESPRNRHVARELARRGWSAALFDLLTPEERRIDTASGQFRFDIDRLRDRAVAVTRELRRVHPMSVPVVAMGSSTGAAVAFAAAAACPESFDAIVSRGGRLDLVRPSWGAIRVPCCLVAGSEDVLCVAIAREAQRRIGGTVDLVEIPGAGHLFEEPGAMDQMLAEVARWLGEWKSETGGDAKRMPIRFQDRRSAGRALSLRLDRWRDRTDALVVGLPRGGVPVAAEVAEALGLAMDAMVVRKVGAPGNPELAMGAVSADGTIVRNTDVLRGLRVTEAEFVALAAVEQGRAEERARRFRGIVPSASLRGRAVIVVDDGIATGATAAAATRVAFAQGARCVVVAAPVASPEAVDRLRLLGAIVECLSVPSDFLGVGAWYDDFGQVGDDEVVECLHGGALRLQRASAKVSA